MQGTDIFLEEPFDADAFAAYGEILSVSGRQPAAETADFSFWNALGEPEVSSVSIGIVRSYPKDELLCPSLERHGNTSETLIPVDGNIIIVCALSRGDDPHRVDPATMRAVRVEKGNALILKPGVWHYAPLVRERPVDTYVIFEKDTPETDLITEAFPADRVIRVRD
jgi:ureidoglycolate hydrolase